MKKIITCLAGALVLIILSINAFAAFSDVPAGVSYSDALDRVAALGIINGTGTGLFKPNNILSREQFAKIVVIASGYKEEALSSMGSTLFSDVASDSPFSGYINVAVKKGLISGMPGGIYYPKEDVTFAQACTVVVKALGIPYEVVSGQWPDNYIDAAKSLELTEGIDLKRDDKIPRWAAAVLIDKVWLNRIKDSSYDDIKKLFGDDSRIYKECLILGNSGTMDRLTSSQVLTDNGIYILNDDKIKLDPGFKYKLILDGDTIVKDCGKINTIQNITVDSIDEDEITYTLDGKIQNMTLPQKTDYYYMGVKQDYDTLESIIYKGSSIAFAWDKDKKSYEYALITDPAGSESGQYIECAVLGDSSVSKRLMENQVATDKGIFYLSDPAMKLELGNRYGLVVKGDRIIKVNTKLKEVISITVNSVFGNTVLYKDDGSTSSFTLPYKTTYYYDGKKQDYDSLKTILKLNSSIILAKDDKNTGYEYAVIIDPVYSKPLIAYNYNGDIDFKNVSIIKNGFIIGQGDIEENNVVYQITDAWGKNGYVLVVDVKILGVLESVYPNVLAPETLKLAGTESVYEISKDMDLNKIKSLKPNDIVNVLLGYDGKVVDIIKL